MSRPYHVYDYEGEHLGSFATWDTAHEWAHLQAVMNGVPTPLEVEDRRAAERRRVWADRCEALDVEEEFTSGPVFSGGGLCTAVATAVFAPPRPRQPS